jgi:hypothetical protein
VVVWWRLCALHPTLGVPPAAAPEEVQYDEPAEEENRDYYKEPYDAKKKIECIQSSLDLSTKDQGPAARSRDGRI